jgi:hypothetical protein
MSAGAIADPQRTKTLELYELKKAYHWLLSLSLSLLVYRFVLFLFTTVETKYNPVQVFIVLTLSEKLTRELLSKQRPYRWIQRRIAAQKL